MTVRYPLRLFFDCSTAHLSPASRDYLGHHAARGDAMVASTPYGWFVWCGSDTDVGFPADLSEIMGHARSVGAEYVLFDADAEECPALPTFAWAD